MSPYLGSKSSVPLDDCQTCAGRGEPSYQTLVKSAAGLASGWPGSNDQATSARGVRAHSPLSLGETATASAGSLAESGPAGAPASTSTSFFSLVTWNSRTRPSAYPAAANRPRWEVASDTT